MTITENLKKYFGYDSFRGGQEEIIQDILNGKDVLAIMPTGAGKSICFQLPAVMKSGITLVISPLISLMKDQVGALIQAGIPAAYLNSTLTARQMEMALYNAENGKYKLIYVAPERLLAPSFLEFANNAQIDMITVDEAHCISQWGQDFRPSYAQIPQFISSLNIRPVVSAFTATATLQVKEDIVEILELRSPKILATGFDRENLYFEVQSPKDKMQALINFVKDNADKAGIVYCATRKNVELVCDTINNNGIMASRYHAGLTESERHGNQDDFLFDTVQVMVATNAFGMGIDKSNVSYVVHYNMPKDVESYYQEAGRAGRDGTPAHCLLLYSPQDVRTNQWMIENGKDSTYSDMQTERMLKERDYNRLKQMTFYSTTNDCLRSFIIKYFGENTASYCGNCSNCNTKFETMDITQEAIKILSCVQLLGQHFGITMVINVLRGSKNERIEELRLNQNPMYNKSLKSVNTLRSIIEYLLLQGYLFKTDEQYSVLKLTELSNDVLQGNQKLEMKLAKEKDADVNSTSKSKKMSVVSPEKKELLDELKQLRASIAQKQGVPAYMVFTDRSLIDMCKLVPQTQSQFLQVSGVGDAKLRKYGESFLAVLNRNENLADITPNKKPHKKKKSEIEVLPISEVTERMLDEIKVSSKAVSVSMIAKQINEVLENEGFEKTSGVKISNWLLAHGFLTIEEIDGVNSKLPTKAGEAAGIKRIKQTTENGEYHVNIYAKDIQKHIIEHLLEM